MVHHIADVDATALSEIQRLMCTYCASYVCIYKMWDHRLIHCSSVSCCFLTKYMTSCCSGISYIELAALVKFIVMYRVNNGPYAGALSSHQ